MAQFTPPKKYYSPDEDVQSRPLIFGMGGDQLPSGIGPNISGEPTGGMFELPPPPPAARAINYSGEPVEGMDPELQQVSTGINIAGPNAPDQFPSPYANLLKNIDDPAMRELYLELLRPDRAMQDRLVQHLDAFPVRTQPKVLDRIKAMLSGLSTVGHPQREPFAAAEVEDALRGPYNRALSDWKVQADLGRDLAINERQANVSQRVAAGQIMSQDLANRRLEAQITGQEQRDINADLDREERRRASEENARLRDRQITAGEKRDELRYLLQTQQIDRILYDKDKAYAQLKYTGADGRPIVREIEPDVMTPTELKELDARLAKEKQDANNAAAMARLREAEAGRNQRAQGAEAGRNARAGRTATGKPESPLDRSRRRTNVAREMMLDPEFGETARKYLRFNTRGELDRVGRPLFGDDVKEYQEVLRRFRTAGFEPSELGGTAVVPGAQGPQGQPQQITPPTTPRGETTARPAAPNQPGWGIGQPPTSGVANLPLGTMWGEWELTQDAQGRRGWRRRAK